MKTSQVTVVRVYLTESQGVEPLLKLLHDQGRVRGVTVFRGISGYGESGVLHTAKLIDLSLDQPVVVEFFDDPQKVDDVLERVRARVKPRHIVWWSATVNENEDKESQMKGDHA